MPPGQSRASDGQILLCYAVKGSDYRHALPTTQLFSGPRIATSLPWRDVGIFPFVLARRLSRKRTPLTSTVRLANGKPRPLPPFWEIEGLN